MRIGLIAAREPTPAGNLRAALPLAGQPVLLWQAALLRDLGAQRVICLCHSTGGAVLALQHFVEGEGAAFHALKGFAALPALVKAEDDLIILRDGLVPDRVVVDSMLGPGVRRLVAAIPSDHALTATFPDDFERIDAAHHWAGLLVMRGAAVQTLADFPEDADAVSVLLRLALQGGTPRRLLPPGGLLPERWLLADSAETVAGHEQALIAQAAPDGDRRAPLSALAAALVRGMAPRGLKEGAPLGAALALVMMLGAILAAAWKAPVAALSLAAGGAFAAQISGDYARLAARLLRRRAVRVTGPLTLESCIDALAAVTLWFALSPWPQWDALAALGPLLIGLSRLSAKDRSALGVLASDRAALLLMLAIGAALGLLGEAMAVMALGQLAALLLHRRAD